MRLPRLLLLMISFNVFGTTVASATTPQIAGVPNHCEEALLEIREVSRGTALDEPVNWRPLIKDLRTQGFRDPAAARAFTNTTLNAQFMLHTIRAALNQETWTWASGLNEHDSRAIGAHPFFALADLPIWASLNGFDPGAAVEAFLKRGRDLAPEQYEYLTWWSSLWVYGPSALERVSLLLERDGDLPPVPALWHLARHLNESDRTRFVRRLVASLESRVQPDLSQNPRVALALALFHGLGELPDTIEMDLHQDWSVAFWRDPLTAPGVGVSGFNGVRDGFNPEVSSVDSPSIYDVDDWQGPGIKQILLNNSLVGITRSGDDHTLLALRNVLDEDGRLILAVGGVYELPRGPLRDGNVVRLDKLFVRPISFLFNERTWTGESWRQVQEFTKRWLPAETRAEIFALASQPGMPPMTSEISAARRKIWSALLDGLDEHRRRLESDLR